MRTVLLLAIKFQESDDFTRYIIAIQKLRIWSNKASFLNLGSAESFHKDDWALILK